MRISNRKNLAWLVAAVFLIMVGACGDNTSTGVAGVIQGGVSNAAGTAQALAPTVQAGVSNVVGTAQEGVSKIVGTVQQVAPTVQSNLAGTVQGGATNIAGTVQGVAPTIRSQVEGTVQQGASNVAGSVSGGAGQMTPGVTSGQVFLPITVGEVAVTLDSTTANDVNSQISRALGIQIGGSTSLLIFASDQDPTTTSNNTNTVMTNAGYQVNDNPTNLKKLQNAAVATLYTKSGMPDIYLQILPVTQDGTVDGLDQATSQKINTQLQGKQSIVFFISGQNLGAGGGGQTTPTP